MDKDILYVIACYLPNSKTRCAFSQVSTKAYKATKFLPNVLSNGKKHGLCKKFYHKIKNSMIESEAIRDVWRYKDGKMHGTRKGYSKSGKLKYECNYKDGELHGLYKSYYDCNFYNSSIEIEVIKHECIYKDGKKNGLFKGYRPTGKLEHVLTYKDDKLHGLCTHYYESGTLDYECTYRDNLRQYL